MAIGILLIAGGIVVMGLVSAFARLILDSDLSSGLEFALIGASAYGIILFVTWVMGPLRHGLSLVSLGFHRPASGNSSLLLLPPAVLVASLALSGAYLGVVRLLGGDIPQSVPDDLVMGGPGVILSFAVVVLWAPLVEEVFFRGFVFPGLAGWLGILGAAVASSALFALAHIDRPIFVPPIFVTGMLLAWLYHKTGSIWSSFSAHALQNALAFAISVAG